MGCREKGESNRQKEGKRRKQTRDSYEQRQGRMIYLGNLVRRYWDQLSQSIQSGLTSFFKILFTFDGSETCTENCTATQKQKRSSF